MSHRVHTRQNSVDWLVMEDALRSAALQPASVCDLNMPALLSVLRSRKGPEPGIAMERGPNRVVLPDCIGIQHVPCRRAWPSVHCNTHSSPLHTRLPFPAGPHKVRCTKNDLNHSQSSRPATQLLTPYYTKRTATHEKTLGTCGYNSQ